MSRLIDADALIEDIRKHSASYFADDFAHEWVDQQPTIEHEPQWIPVSERLPDGQGFYLVSVCAPYKTVRVYEYKPCKWFENENLWKKEDGSYCFNWFVEAWMPLPEPYREEGEKDEVD